jgi:hypothetical protein
MFFTDLQLSLLESLRARIRNGELTERSLAKLVGVSQPHIHNVLKGARFLSSTLADQIIRRLHISIFDLIDRERLGRYLALEQPAVPEYTYVPVLEGSLGPGQPWPWSVHVHERFAVPTSQLASITGPVVVRLAEDVRMPGIVGTDGFALLDQSLHARCTIEPNALYAVKLGNTGALRRLRTAGRNVYLVTEDCLYNPAAWERINLEHQQIQHVVRAKATLLAKEINWAV